jgi:hypothetical protein
MRCLPVFLAPAQGGNRPPRAALIRRAFKPARSKIMHDEAGRKVETAVEARAGFLDRPVLLVLCASLALGVVVLGALWFGFFASGA